MREHEEILAAAQARDVERAKRAIRAHLRNAKAELIGHIREAGDEFCQLFAGSPF